MSSDLTTFLFDLLNVTSVTSVATVLICLTSMVIFILRFNTDAFLLNLSPTPSPKTPVHRQHMVPVHNPFVVTLVPGVSNLHDGATLRVSADAECEMTGGWAVNTHAMNSLIQQRACIHPLTFEDPELCVRVVDDIQPFCPCSEVEITLTRPDGVNEDIIGTTIPRVCYPLVVVVTDTTDHSQDPPDTITGLLSVFHLSDSFCQSASHTIMQYIILSSGRLCRLEHLYSSSESDHTGTEEKRTTRRNSTSHLNRKTRRRSSINTDENDTPSPLPQTCVVCQTADVSHVLLPCRHSCVCSACFHQLHACPMCRGDIRAYFTLDGASYSDDYDDDDDEGDRGNVGVRLTWVEWVTRLNDILNDWLTF